MRFRASLAKFYEVPEDWPNCIFGFPMGQPPPPAPIQITISAKRDPFVFAKWWQREAPKRWAILHRWAMTADLSTSGARKTAKEWLDAFTNQLPCGDCKNEFAKGQTINPPNYSSNDTLFAWTYEEHERINRILGKPGMALEAARATWSEKR